MENQCDTFLFFREYIDLLCKDVLPYLFEQSLTLLKNWAFVVFCIFLFLRKGIITFIERIKEIHFRESKIVTQNIKPHDVALDTQTYGINKDFDRKQDNSKKNIPLPPIPDSVFQKVLQEQEKIINTQLKDNPFKKEDVLLRELASYQLALEYERIFKDIFKSQFDALEMLNSRKKGMLQKDFLPFYEQAKQQNPNAYLDFSFENWFAFFDFNYFLNKDGNRFKATEKSKSLTYYIIVKRKYNIQYKGL